VTDVDLLVAGGGPVGLAVAIGARAAGLSVAVVEARDVPVDKACGEGLMPAAVSALGRLGVPVTGRPCTSTVPALAGSALECRTAPMHLWAQLDYDRLKKDGDLNLEGYHSDRWSALIGFDANVGPTAVLGISGGYVRNEANTNDFGSSDIKGDGWQVGAYGVYDPGAFYVKALGTYSHFSGDSRRRVDWTGLGFGGTLAGTASGSGADPAGWLR